MVPDSTVSELKVRVRLIPIAAGYDIYLETDAGTTLLVLAGTLDDAAEPALRAYLDNVVASRPSRLVIQAENLETLSPRTVRAIAFSRSKVDLEQDIFFVAPSQAVQEACQAAGVWEEFTALDKYDRGMFN
jgi:anti-anti-sigma regulatory factor